jgi:tetratricopeptide (TPR) repeat protein
MTTRRGIGFVAFIAAIILSQSNLEAGLQGRRNNQPEEQGPSYLPSAENQQEFEAFQAVQKEAAPATRITLGDTFLTTYPNSQLAGFVNRFRMEAFSRLNRPRDAVAAGEAALAFETKYVDDMIARADADAAQRNRPRNAAPPIDKNSAAFKTMIAEADKGKLYYYQTLMTSYQQLNDAPKSIEYGEKALAVDPQNLAALLTVSNVMAERPPADEKAKETQMKRAEELGKKAESGVTQLLIGAGAQMAAAQKAGLQAGVHQTLGTIYLNQKKFSDAQKSLLTALTFEKDPVTYLRLGLAYAQATPERVDEAMDAMAKSVFLKGVTEAQARDLLQKLYQARKRSLDGLDEYIQEAGSKINQ